MSNWDFKNKAVQQYDNPESSGQLGSKAVLISFGPPTFNGNQNTIVCGLVQNLNMNQQRQIRELFEVGSERRYWVDGPTRNNLSISRALFSGPSLLKIAGMGLFNRGIDPNDVPNINSDIFQGQSRNAVSGGVDNNFWINLSSDMFKNPLGLLLDFREFYGTGESTSYGSVYLSNAKIQAHSMNMQAGNWLMQENIQMQFETPIPLSRGSKHEDHYRQRQAIMETTHDMSPEWFDEYSNWMGERSTPTTNTTV